MGVRGMAKPSKNSVARRVVLDIINGTTASGYTQKEYRKEGDTWALTGRMIIRPVVNSGKSYLDRTEEIASLLDKLGLMYTTGNEAPKGGKLGDFIKITTKIERE